MSHCYLCTARTKKRSFSGSLANTKMNKKINKFTGIVKNMMIMIALTQVICGEKYMKRLQKRLMRLPKETQVEIWLQTCNHILPADMHVSLSKSLASSPIVTKQAQRIIDHVISMPMMPYDELVKRTNEILQNMEEYIGL